MTEETAIEPRKRGGARPGAGRPPKGLTKSDIQKAQALANKLKSFSATGLDKLAEKMPDLMEAALEEALDTVDEADNPKPRNIQMLKFLLSLGISFVDLEQFKDRQDGVGSILADAKNNPVSLTQEVHHHYAESADNVPVSTKIDGEAVTAETSL